MPALISVPPGQYRFVHILYSCDGTSQKTPPIRSRLMAQGFVIALKNYGDLSEAEAKKLMKEIERLELPREPSWDEALDGLEAVIRHSAPAPGE